MRCELVMVIASGTIYLGLRPSSVMECDAAYSHGPPDSARDPFGFAQSGSGQDDSS